MLAIRAVYQLIRKCGVIQVEEVNKEVIPRTGAVILASNHISEADPPILMAAAPINRTPVALAMAELWWIPGLNLVLWLLGQIPVRRGSYQSGVRATRRGIRVLKHGGLVAIYPEAGCSKTGTMRKFKRGVADMATATGALVIPVYISGSNQLKPVGNWRINLRAQVRIEFGKPIDPTEFEGPHQKELILAELRQRIEEMKFAAEQGV